MPDDPHNGSEIFSVHKLLWKYRRQNSEDRRQESGVRIKNHLNELAPQTRYCSLEDRSGLIALLSQEWQKVMPLCFCSFKEHAGFKIVLPP